MVVALQRQQQRHRQWRQRRGMSRHHNDSSSSGSSSGSSGREVVLLCEECHAKMLALGELLLLSCEARPVFTAPQDLQLSRQTFSYYRDKVVDKLNRILIASRDVASQVHSGGGSGSVHWKGLAARVQELGGLVTGLTELSAHIGYLVAVNFPRSRASPLGVVNKYKLCQARLDLKFCCSRLRRSCVDDLDPHLLVELCSTMSRALSSMTEVCRQGGERAREVEDQSQFKLCVKSVTSTTSCLIASVKRFKSSPSVEHLRRIIAFCDPVVSASSAVVTFASEEEFIGQPAQLSEKAAEAHKSVLGMTMSIVSASIQMCKAIRDLVYDLSNARHRERIRLCVDSTDKASSKLRDLLLSCDFEPKVTTPEPKADSPDTKPTSDESLTGSVASTVTGSDPSTMTGSDASTMTGSVASTVTGSDASTVTGSDASTVTGSVAATMTGSDASTVDDSKTEPTDEKSGPVDAQKSAGETRVNSSEDSPTSQSSSDAKPSSSPTPHARLSCDDEDSKAGSIDTETSSVVAEDLEADLDVGKEVKVEAPAAKTSEKEEEKEEEDVKDATGELPSPSVDVPSVLDAVACGGSGSTSSSIDSSSYVGSTSEAHSYRLDLRAGSGDMEKAVTASGLMATSPVLNLSTYSVGSIPDVDPDVGVSD